MLNRFRLFLSLSFSMKTKIGLTLVGICTTFTAIAFCQNVPPESQSAKPSSQATPSASATVPSDPGMTLGEAQKVLSTARKYVAHPEPSGERRAPARTTSPDFEMSTPPPLPRAETKSAIPESGFVWVPGHYMPVKGEWRWVRGEWAPPATPESVWIPASYDAKEKKWSPGYWQPDRPYTPEPASPTKEGVPPPRKKY